MTIDEREPLFSVIIPSYDRSGQLAECLAALDGLVYPRDRFEVIVIDDGSPRSLERVTTPFKTRFRLRVVRQENAGPGRSRNLGAYLARGTFLAFTDDDCRPAPDWLSKMEERLCQAPDRIVGGRTKNQLDDNLYSNTSQIIVDVAYAHYNKSPEAARFFATNNVAVPAATFRRIGGFDERFRVASEDREFCDRWLHLGHRMAYAPEAVVHHAHALSLRSFCVQHFRYGRGARQFHVVRTARGSGRLRDELKFHGRFLSLLRTPLRRLGPRQAVATGVLLLLWQIVNALGYAYEIWLGSVHGGARTALGADSESG